MLGRAAALEAEVAGEVAAPVGLVLVSVLEVVGVVTGACCEVVGVTGVVLAVVVPAPVVVPELGGVEEAVRQAVLELAWTVKAADWARAPVLSRRLRPSEVPAVTLTVHVIEVPVWVPKSRRAGAEG